MNLKNINFQNLVSIMDHYNLEKIHFANNGGEETNTPIGVFLSAEGSASNGARNGEGIDDTINMD